MTQSTSQVNESLISAAKHFNDGNLEKADFNCRSLLKNDPKNADALHLLALISVRRNKLEESINLLQQACECRPNDPEFLTNLGNLTKVAGDVLAARQYYEKAILADPRSIVAFNNLALLLSEQQEYEQAIEVYKQAIALDRNIAELHFALSLVYKANGQNEEAIKSCYEAIGIRSDYVDATIHLANLFFEKNLIAKALNIYEQAARLSPKNAIIFNGIGVCQTNLGDYLAAKKALLTAVELAPNLADTQNNLAFIHLLLGEYDYAIACLKAALKINPEYAVAWRNYANVMTQKKEYKQAIEFYKKALALQPDFYEAQLELAGAYVSGGEAGLAKLGFKQAQLLNPNALAPLCGKIGASLASFYNNAQEVEAARDEYIAGLDELEKCVDEKSYDLNEIEEAIILAQPTYLSYQGLDDREILTKYGKILQKIMHEKYPQWSRPRVKRTLKTGDKIRLGIVSRHFSNHVDWRMIISGLVNKIDRSQFDLYAYSTGGISDDVTKYVSNQIEKFYSGLDLAHICTSIDKDELDILLFPELGLDPVSLKIACLNLAPIQCAAWGRADISGLATINYYLSPAIMAEENAQDHYEEKLVLLPESGFYYQPVTISKEEASSDPLKQASQEVLSSFGLRADAVKFLCVQSLFKYLPQYDFIFIELAKAIPNAQFIFVGRPEILAHKFFERLQKAFAEAALDSTKYVTMLPILSHAQFIKLCGCADMFLDSIGYSGCLTALEAIDQNIPIVTVKGTLMRGRQSAGILNYLGLSEMVAEDTASYIRNAIKLAKDVEYRKFFANKIADSKARLYNNKTVIRDYEAKFKRG